MQPYQVSRAALPNLDFTKGKLGQYLFIYSRNKMIIRIFEPTWSDYLLMNAGKETFTNAA